MQARFRSILATNPQPDRVTFRIVANATPTHSTPMHGPPPMLQASNVAKQV